MCVAAIARRAAAIAIRARGRAADPCGIGGAGAAAGVSAIGRAAGIRAGIGSAAGRIGAEGSGGAADPGSGAGSERDRARHGIGIRARARARRIGIGSAAPVIIQIPTDLNAPEVSAAASPTVVRLGGKFTLFITATFGAGVEVNLREPIDLGPAFEVKRKRVARTSRAADGRTIREWQLEVIAWELGDLRDAGDRGHVHRRRARPGRSRPTRVPLRVDGVLGDVVDDPKAMRGNAPPTELIARDWFWLSSRSAARWRSRSRASSMRRADPQRRRASRAYADRLARRRRRPRRIDMTSERALERLLEIEQSGVLDRDDDRKEGYAEMVDVIREYLGARYRVATLDLTIERADASRSRRSRPSDERALDRRAGSSAATSSSTAASARPSTTRRRRSTTRARWS